MSGAPHLKATIVSGCRALASALPPAGGLRLRCCWRATRSAGAGPRAASRASMLRRVRCAALLSPGRDCWSCLLARRERLKIDLCARRSVPRPGRAPLGCPHGVHSSKSSHSDSQSLAQPGWQRPNASSPQRSRHSAHTASTCWAQRAGCSCTRVRWSPTSPGRPTPAAPPSWCCTKEPGCCSRVQRPARLPQLLALAAQLLRVWLPHVNGAVLLALLEARLPPRVPVEPCTHSVGRRQSRECTSPSVHHAVLHVRLPPRLTRCRRSACTLARSRPSCRPIPICARSRRSQSSHTPCAAGASAPRAVSRRWPCNALCVLAYPCCSLRCCASEPSVAHRRVPWYGVRPLPLRTPHTGESTPRSW